MWDWINKLRRGVNNVDVAHDATIQKRFSIKQSIKIIVTWQIVGKVGNKKSVLKQVEGSLLKKKVENKLIRPLMMKICTSSYSLRPLVGTSRNTLLRCGHVSQVTTLRGTFFSLNRQYQY